jgi:hypothetical protein
VAVQPPGARLPGGCRQDQYFGVGGGVVVDLAPIVVGCDDLSAWVDDDCSDWHIPMSGGESGLVESQSHDFFHWFRPSPID